MVNRKIVGIPLAMFIVGALVMGTATAALVSFLSNPVSATADVDSPIALSFWDGASWVENVNLGSTYGGGTIDLLMKEENFASNDVDSTLSIVISEAGVVNVCGEIDALRFREQGMSGWTTLTCDDTLDNDLHFSASTTVVANQDLNYEIQVEFNKFAQGSYTATVQHT